jgi:hypothetical protein
MSFTSQSPLATNVLLLFESGLRDQQRELEHVVERGQKEIRALADSGPGDIMDDSCGNACKENILASYSHNRTLLRKVELALKRVFTGDFGSVLPVGTPSASNGYKPCHGQPTASHARSNPSKAESIE